METLIVWCGISHFVLCTGSLYIPKALDWKGNLTALHPLMRQIFWTYAGFILGINLCFGIISVFGSTELLNRSFLAKATTLLIGIYWLARIMVQFFYFDKRHAPKGSLYVIGEAALIGLFTIFTVIYMIAFFINNEWL